MQVYLCRRDGSVFERLGTSWEPVDRLTLATNTIYLQIKLPTQNLDPLLALKMHDRRFVYLEQGNWVGSGCLPEIVSLFQQRATDALIGTRVDFVLEMRDKMIKDLFPALVGEEGGI
jgi:hypothetical protein